MRLLICTDGSMQATEMVRFGSLIAQASCAEVTVLGVAEAAADQPVIAEALQKAELILNDRRVACQTEEMLGNPVVEIARWAERHRPDLVLIGATRKGRRGPYCMSLKAYQLLKRINFPVLICLGPREKLAKILICSGGKSYIEKGFQITAELARCAGAAITLLNVIPAPPGIFSGIPQWQETTEQVLSSGSSLGGALRQQRDALGKLNLRAEVKVRTGFVLAEIFKEISEGDYDVVVVGASLAADPISKYVLSDVSREVLNQSDRPVLVVRSSDEGKGVWQRLARWMRGTRKGKAMSKGAGEGE